MITELKKPSDRFAVSEVLDAVKAGLEGVWAIHTPSEQTGLVRSGGDEISTSDGGGCALLAASEGWHDFGAFCPNNDDPFAEVGYEGVPRLLIIAESGMNRDVALRLLRELADRLEKDNPRLRPPAEATA